MNGTLTSSNFNKNTAIAHGGGIFWNGVGGILVSSTFTENKANVDGAGVYWSGANANLIDSTFNSNTANRYGGAIFLRFTGSMNNCSFLNSNSVNSNGIYANTTLNINGGNGIVNLFTQDTLSGISIVVLNNETYYYPPNTNINFTK